MTVRDDLVAAKEAFRRMPPPKRIQSAHRVACHRSDTALASIVALREALPAHFTNIAQFEASPRWRLKDAFAVFDRAIASAKASS